MIRLAREKFHTLTEQMFYILLCLRQERCGVDVMEAVRQLTDGRVVIGPGTLYTLLEDFLQQEWISEGTPDGRKRRYRLTERGERRLQEEAERLRLLYADYCSVVEKREEESP